MATSIEQADAELMASLQQKFSDYELGPDYAVSEARRIYGAVIEQERERVAEVLREFGSQTKDRAWFASILAQRLGVAKLL